MIINLFVVVTFYVSNPLSKPEKAVYPDAIAVALDTVNHRVGQYIDFINFVTVVIIATLMLNDQLSVLADLLLKFQ